MSTQNTMAGVLEDTRESGLHDHTDTLVVERSEALIREVERPTEPLMQPRRDQRQMKPSYPEWPTSTPGPQATSPLPGMKPVPTRSDQMAYECYDQERGMPCTLVVAKPAIRPHPLADQVKAGQHVYDAQGERVGKILVCWPDHILVERGLMFRRSYYVPLSLVQGVEGQRVRLTVSEATLIRQGFTRPPDELYHVPRPPEAVVFPDISSALHLGKFPPTPAETGHYHYGPRGPGMNTDASGSYAPYEIDPYGRPVDRPVKLHSTGKLLHSRKLS